MKKAGCLLLCFLLLFCAGCSFTPIGTGSSAPGGSRTESRQHKAKSDQTQTASFSASAPEVSIGASDGMPAVIDGKDVGVAADKKTDPGTDVAVSGARYVGNKKSKTFHKSDCSAVGKMKAENTCAFSSRAEAINAGYHGCSQCRP